MSDWYAFCEVRPKKNQKIDVCFNGTFDLPDVWILCDVTMAEASEYNPFVSAYWRHAETVPAKKFPWKE